MYIYKLTIGDFLDLYKAILPECVSRGITGTKVVDDGIAVTYWELFKDPQGKSIWKDSTYIFTDFEPPKSKYLTDEEAESVKTGFYRYMIRKFGFRYTMDLLSNVTGINFKRGTMDD